MKSSPGLGRAARFGAFEVDLRAGELRKHGIKIKLQDQPFQILVLLLAKPGEVMTREELRQKLWPAMCVCCGWFPARWPSFAARILDRCGPNLPRASFESL